jgi:hypothetical protein
MLASAREISGDGSGLITKVKFGSDAMLKRSFDVSQMVGPG